MFAADDGPGAAASTAVTCTKCRQNFATRASLHAHIVDCGDYWRSLSERLTWVFVLRGSELPAAQSASSAGARKQQQADGRRRGKYRWGSSASHESVRRQMQRMLIKQHVGTGESSRRASVRISLQTAAGDASPPLGDPAPPPAAAAARRPLPPPPALRRPVRRRAAAGGSTSAADHDASAAAAAVAGERGAAAKCERCTAAFDSEAERDTHAACCGADEQRNADTKDRDDDDDDDDIDPTKHMCIYCGRQFTFLRALRRHVADGCSVRRDLVERQEYVDDEWEAELRAAAGGGRSSTGGGSADAAADDDAAAADGARRSGGKRRRRCKNWGSGKSKSRRSARSSGDDADDSLFGWEDAYLSTWGKDERADITRRDRQPADTELKSATALAHLLTTDITINVSDRATRTSSDDIDALVQRSSSSATTTSPAAVTTAATTTTSSFAVKLELLTGAQDNDDKPKTLPDVGERSRRAVSDVVLVMDEAPTPHDDDDDQPRLDSSGTSSSDVGDARLATTELATDSREENDDGAQAAAQNDDDAERQVPDDVTGDDEAVAAAENGGGDADVACRLKARRRRTRRLTLIKRKKS